MDNRSRSFRSPPARSPLKIGLLIESIVASQYVYEFLEWAQSRPSIFEIHLILRSQQKLTKKIHLADFVSRWVSRVRSQGLYHVFSEWALCVVEALEREIIKGDKNHHQHLQRCDLSSLAHSVILASSKTYDLTSRSCFSASDIASINGLNLDLIVNLERSTPSGPILHAAKLGVISICAGDDQTTRGDPAGFWEVYHQQDTTGFTVKRLRDEYDAEQVLVRGKFATRHYYLLKSGVSASQGVLFPQTIG